MPIVTPRPALAYLGMIKQSAQNSPGVPTTFFIIKKQEFMATQDVVEHRLGNQRDIGYTTKEKFLFAGAFETPLFANEGAFLTAAAMGADTKTGAGDPYQHALSFADPLPYYTTEVAWYNSNLIERVIDSKVARWQLMYEAGGKEAIIRAGLMGCTVAVQSSPLTPSFSNGAGEGPMKGDQCVFTLTGPSDASTIAAQIQKLQIDLDQGVVDQPGPGQISPIALPEEGRRIGITGTALFTSDALHRLGFYGSSSGSSVSAVPATGSVDFTFTSQAASPGPERSARFTTPNLVWKLTKPMFDPDGKTGLIDFEAVAYRSGATLPFTATFKNGVSTAYI